MLNHDLAKYFLAVTAIIIAGGCWLLDWGWLWCLVPFGIFIMNLIYGSFNIRSNYHLKSINDGPQDDNRIALTFDDGPTEFTPGVLDLLMEKNAKATFFCIGSSLDANTEIAKRAYAEGHHLANHSYNHGRGFDFASKSTIAKEIQETNYLLRKIVGASPKWFRPPYGVTNPNIKKVLEQMKMISIGWSNRSLDTLKEAPEKVVQRVMSKVKGGDIVLFHDSHDRISPILEQFLNEIEKTEFKIVPLEELIDEKAYS